VENAAINVRKEKNVKYILKQMVPYLVEVFVGKSPKIGIALVPQNFAEIATRNVGCIGAPILVNLLALKLQDLKKKSLRLLRPQRPPSGQVSNSP
jgi:hypothetical protein